MRAVKSRDTSPELILRKALWAKGLRYRIGGRDIVGKPDIVFVRDRVAVFVDGDFWHGNQWRKRGFDSLESQLAHVNNKEYWIRKINRNIARDREVDEKLGKAGWKVVRIWESGVKEELNKQLVVIEKALKAAGNRRNV